MSERVEDGGPALLPCPFCGGSQLSEGGRSWVVCHGCGAEGPFDPKPGAKAAAAWNRRSPSEPLNARTQGVEVGR